MSWNDVILSVEQAKRELGEDADSVALATRAKALAEHAMWLLHDAERLRRENAELRGALAAFAQRTWEDIAANSPDVAEPEPSA